MGDLVGARPNGFGGTIESANFAQAIDWIEREAALFRVVLLGCEENPAHCGRRLRVGRVLMERGARLLHIRGEGTLEGEQLVYAASGKVPVEGQAMLFEEIEEERWRSAAAVLHRRPSGALSPLEAA